MPNRPNIKRSLFSAAGAGCSKTLSARVGQSLHPHWMSLTRSMRFTETDNQHYCHSHKKVTACDTPGEGRKTHACRGSSTGFSSPICQHPCFVAPSLTYVRLWLPSTSRAFLPSRTTYDFRFAHLSVLAYVLKMPGMLLTESQKSKLPHWKLCCAQQTWMNTSSVCSSSVRSWTASSSSHSMRTKQPL